jgi:uncharacterized protein
MSGSPFRPVREEAEPGPRRSRPGPLAALAGLLGLVMVLPSGCASAQEVPGLQNREIAPPVVVVRGQGQVEVAPDRAKVAFAVETEAESAQEAAEDNARRMTRAIEAVREAGRDLPGLRVETSGYALTPRYRTPRETSVREIVGYTARNHVLVTVDDVDGVGRLMDAALQNGANRVANLQFLLQDPEPHRESALREAVRKARAEAEIMAQALGMRLGEALQVDGGAEVPFPRPFADFQAVRMMEMEAAPTPVEAGAQTVSAAVTIRFRLESSR